MRRTDILDNPEATLSIKGLWEIISRHLEEGSIDVMCGCSPYDRSETILVFHNWEDLTQFTALLNGWEGKQVAVLWRNEDVDKELRKAEKELEETTRSNPNHLGTIYRLKARIEQLHNFSSYKKWLQDNNYEERILEDFEGVTVGFSDEYDECGNCRNNIVRTSPDSYHWSPPLFLEDFGYVCEQCMEEGDFQEEILREFKNRAKGLPEDFNIEESGLVKVNDHSYENGWHRGQDDDPQKIINAFNERGIDVWFTVENSQFYVEFDVYVKEDDARRGAIPGRYPKHLSRIFYR